MSSLKLYVSAGSLCALAGFASGQLRVAAWNISNYDGASRAADIQTATYDSFSGRQFAPDVLAVQEILSAGALNTLVTVLNSASGSPGDWASGGFISGPDTQSVLVYRQSKLQLVRLQQVAAGSSATTNQPRNTYRYDLRLQGYGNLPVNHLAVYSVHMKAGSTQEDQDRRLIEAMRIRDNAEGVNTFGANSGLPAGYHFVIAGDFNIQTSTQAAYQEMVGSQANNAGRFFDPINSAGSWNNSMSFRFIHTQDPIGAGGMDDRHDQILVSNSLINAAGLDYIGNAALPYSTTTWNDPNHSYRVWGNDGTSFNLALTVAGNAMVGPTIATALRNVATPGGGHLPILLDLRVPAKASSETTLDFGTVTQGSTAPTRTLNVSNAGDTGLWNAAGIATLTYTLPTATGFTIPVGSFNDAPGGAGNAHVITMPTSSVGVKTTTISIPTNDPDQPTRMVQLVGEVISATNQNPLANAGPDQVVHDVNGNGTEPVTLNGSGSSDPDGTITNYRWEEGVTLLANGASPTANVVLSAGTHTITLTVTDNQSATATDTVVVIVNRLPTANAGADQMLTDTDNSGSEMVTLDGSGSSDADGTITNYRWSEGVTVLASGASASANVSLSVGTHVIDLIVTDNRGVTATDSVTIVIEAPAGCNPDYNMDGSADNGDIVDLVNDIAAGTMSFPPHTPDFNGDGGGDNADVEALVNVIAGGPCP